MAFDGIFLHQIVKQLDSIKGGKITRIYQISDTEVLFVLKGYANCQLMISAHSSYNRIHLTDRDYPTRQTPSNFIMLLRKYLEGGVITSIQQVSLDRYLIIEVSSRNDIGDRINLQLYVELMGKYANIILVNQGRIIDALKHIPPFENTIRTIQPGAVFKPTDPQVGKLNPFEIDEVDESENLFEHLIGFSPLLSDEFVYRMNRHQSYKSIIEEILASDSVYISEVNGEQYFHCIPLTHLSDKWQKYEICQGLDYLYYSKEEKERIRQITGDLFKFTRKEISKFTNKIDKLNQSLAEASDCDKYRYYGEIVYANLDKITKGMKSVVLTDFDGNNVTIALDNKLDGKGNGKKFFTRYRKLSTGKKYINEQLQIAQNNLEYFNAIQEQLMIADFSTAEEIKTELVNNGYLKNRQPKKKSKKSLEPNYTKIEFNGKMIYVGKNNIQNDFVTFKIANRMDYWFHVKDASGSHVVINSDQPNEAEIRFCAMLAAYYSKYRQSSSIPVNYTQVKQLKKIPESKLGKVSMKEYKTIYIDIDLDLLSQYITL